MAKKFKTVLNFTLQMLETNDSKSVEKKLIYYAKCSSVIFSDPCIFDFGDCQSFVDSDCITGLYGFCINNKNREYGVRFTRKGPKTVSEMLKRRRIKRWLWTCENVKN